MAFYLAKNLQNLIYFSEDLWAGSWGWTNTSVYRGIFPSPDGDINASRIEVDCATNPNVYQIYSPFSKLAGQSYNFSVWAWTEVGTTNSIRLELYGTTSLEGHVYSDFTLTSSPTRFDIYTEFSSSDVSTAFYAELGIMDASSAYVGDYIYVFAFQIVNGTDADPYIRTGGITYTNCSDYLEVLPNYDMEIGSKKIESSSRTKSGVMYKYLFGSYETRKFSVSYVDSSFKAVVNSWWRSNTALMFIEDEGFVVNSVYLSNKGYPIDSIEEPYTSLFKGVIELESY